MQPDLERDQSSQHQGNTSHFKGITNEPCINV